MLKNNRINLLISIVAAIVLWAYITTVVNPETEVTVSGIPVELVNIESLNDRGFTVDEGMTYLVDVTVTGSRSDVSSLTENDFKATADMTGYRKGENSVPVNITGPNGIELLQLRPDTIFVTVVELITVNKPVRLEFEDTFASDEEPRVSQIIPEEMEVSGVAEAVDSVDYIRATIPEGALTEEETTIRVDVTAVDDSGDPVYNVGLSQNSVEVVAELCKTKQVPLSVELVGEANENVEITDTYIPSFITIRGPEAAIEGITEVESRVIDISEITSTTEIPIDPYLPNGVDLADISQDLAVKIEVQGIIKKEFEYAGNTIEITNLTSSLSGHVSTGSVTVTILAAKDIADALTQDDIKLSVDAEGIIRAGEAIEMDVIATCEIEEIKSITVTPAKVRVTLIN